MGGEEARGEQRRGGRQMRTGLAFFSLPVTLHLEVDIRAMVVIDQR